MVTQLLVTLVLFIVVCAWLIVMTAVVERQLKKYEDKIDDVVFKFKLEASELRHANEQDAGAIREMIVNQISANSNRISKIELKLDKINKEEE